MYHNVLFTSFLLSLPFLLTYFITFLQSSKATHSGQKNKPPPTSPYYIPGLGHSLAFLWDTSKVAKLARSNVFPPIPIRLQLFNTGITFVTGSNNIIAVWRSKVLEAREVTSFSLRQFFNTPKPSMKIYHTDDSGINLQPHPSSNVPFKDRYYFHTRKDTVGFFNGPGLKNIAYRFQGLLKARISQLDIAEDWIEFPDLFLFIQDVLTGPVIEAMCGPALIDQCPTFVEDFWKLDGDILYFFKGFPRWLAPRAWRNRDKLLDSVKKWHTYARENFDASFVESDGHDRCYGSPLMRSRQNYPSKVDGLNADALASQDLGLIWAENANSIPAVFSLFAELLQQPTVLRQSREAIEASLFPSSRLDNPSLDIESLCSKPLLQSIYAETLRLYTSLFALRSAAHEDFKLGDWSIPCNKMIAVDSRVAHMDTNIWNTGSSITSSEGPYPLHKFWAARFIEYETDPSSGPLQSRRPKPQSTATESQGSAGRYTMEGLSGAWLPFGGGSRQCPGRNFAKQEIILSFALIATMFDIELLEGTKKDSMQPDMKYYGLGTLPPKGKVPFRIRRR